MTDTEQWALNREIAKGLGLDYEGWRIGQPDFAGDLNAAWEMGERLREMGLAAEYGLNLWRLAEIPDVAILSNEEATERLARLPAETRAQAAAEVLRERGAK